MNANVEKPQQSNAINSFLWVVTIAIVAGGVYANAYFSGESLLYRVLGLLALALLASLIALQTTQGRAFWELVKGSRSEIRKVVWPTRQENVQTTLIVMAVVIVTGLILWGLDSVLGKLASMVIG